jgi:hypothetical protein
MFDFDPTTNQTINETVTTLAGMFRFVIADITDARSVPQELQIIDTYCRTVAVRLIKSGVSLNTACWISETPPGSLRAGVSTKALKS